MITVKHVAACPVIFILLYDQNWQADVLKLTKNAHFLEVLAVWVLFSRFLGILRSEL